jgi:hypothetical protein
LIVKLSRSYRTLHYLHLLVRLFGNGRLQQIKKMWVMDKVSNPK